MNGATVAATTVSMMSRLTSIAGFVESRESNNIGGVPKRMSGQKA
jgi:hypothetical protein